MIFFNIFVEHCSNLRTEILAENQL